MSNRFNLSQFSTSLFTLTCSREEKPVALAKFIAESLRDSAVDWLLEGSDCLTQVLAKFENSGKTAVAVKFRKIIRNSGASLAPYGEISAVLLRRTAFRAAMVPPAKKIMQTASRFAKPCTRKCTHMRSLFFNLRCRMAPLILSLPSAVSARSPSRSSWRLPALTS